MLEAATTPYRRRDMGSERIWSLNIADIQPDPGQARRIFEENKLRELAESIREFGIMQPLIVRKTGNRFTLIAGERRLRAAAMAGLKHVPCIISSADEERAAYMALVENLQRRDLDCFEEAEGLARLISTYGLTQEEAAARLGKSQSAVANKLRLLKLDTDCVLAIRRAGLTERHARTLLRLRSKDEILAAVQSVKEKKLSVAETERYVDELMTPAEPEKTIAIPKEKTNGKSRSLESAIQKAVAAARALGELAEISKTETAEALTITVKVKKTG